MKTIKLPLFVLAVICSIFLNSCNNQDYDLQIPEKVYGELSTLENKISKNTSNEGTLFYEYKVENANEYVRYKTYIENKRLRSILSYKLNESKWIDVSVFDLDLQNANYENDMNTMIEKHAKVLKKKLDIVTIGRIGNILEGFPEALYYKLGKDGYNNKLSLSIFYHLAAFNASRRAYENKSKDCQCGTNKSYLSGESPFFCAEDVMISADKAYDFIKEKYEIKKSKGYNFNPKSLLKHLSNESGEFISASKINKFLKEELDSYFKKISRKEKLQILDENYTLSNVVMTKSSSETDDTWPFDPSCWLYGARLGSDCGCCGNYSGTCYKCYVECYLHDQACETCEPEWFCLSGCVPGPC